MCRNLHTHSLIHLDIFLLSYDILTLWLSHSAHWLNPTADKHGELRDKIKITIYVGVKWQKQKLLWQQKLTITNGALRSRTWGLESTVYAMVKVETQTLNLKIHYWDTMMNTWGEWDREQVKQHLATWGNKHWRRQNKWYNKTQRSQDKQILTKNIFSMKISVPLSYMCFDMHCCITKLHPGQV